MDSYNKPLLNKLAAFCAAIAVYCLYSYFQMGNDLTRISTLETSGVETRATITSGSEKSQKLGGRAYFLALEFEAENGETRSTKRMKVSQKVASDVMYEGELLAKTISILYSAEDIKVTPIAVSDVIQLKSSSASSKTISLYALGMFSVLTMIFLFLKTKIKDN